MAKDEQVGDWTGRLPHDKDPATREHRRAQGLWRSDVLRWPAGAPTGGRTRERYPTLPNYLAKEHDGSDPETQGVNLMSTAARTYTRERLPVIEALDGTATRDRLYRNLLSSQPMAFSVAGELRAHPDAASRALGGLAGLSAAGLDVLTGDDVVVPDEQRQSKRYQTLPQYALNSIEAEWYPPRWAHTKDRSGFDLAACLRLDSGRRVLVSIEVKYTDSFSKKPLVIWDRYRVHLEALGLTEETTQELVDAGASQVLRQVMITDSVRRFGLVPGVGSKGRVDEALAVVLARHDDQTAQRIVEVLNAALPLPVLFWSHRDFFNATRREAELADWSRLMSDRYVPAS